MGQPHSAGQPLQRPLLSRRTASCQGVLSRQARPRVESESAGPPICCQRPAATVRFEQAGPGPCRPASARPRAWPPGRRRGA